MYKSNTRGEKEKYEKCSSVKKWFYLSLVPYERVPVRTNQLVIHLLNTELKCRRRRTKTIIISLRRRLKLGIGNNGVNVLAGRLPLLETLLIGKIQRIRRIVIQIIIKRRICVIGADHGVAGAARDVDDISNEGEALGHLNAKPAHIASAERAAMSEPIRPDEKIVRRFVSHSAMKIDSRCIDVKDEVVLNDDASGRLVRVYAVATVIETVRFVNDVLMDERCHVARGLDGRLPAVDASADVYAAVVAQYAHAVVVDMIITNYEDGIFVRLSIGAETRLPTDEYAAVRNVGDLVVLNCYVVHSLDSYAGRLLEKIEAN